MEVVVVMVMVMVTEMVMARVVVWMGMTSVLTLLNQTGLPQLHATEQKAHGSVAGMTATAHWTTF